MKASDKAFDLIKKWEGIMDGDPSTANLDPYLCPANYWTIGWGHVVRHNKRMLHGEEDRELAKLEYPIGVTFQQALTLLRGDVAEIEPYLNRMIKIPISQCMYDALVSFAYNVGAGALQNSTLLKKLNSNKPLDEVAKEFHRWVKASGKKLQGLVNRRAEEANLFLIC